MGMRMSIGPRGNCRSCLESIIDAGTRNARQ
jgi:hypothetical protein